LGSVTSSTPFRNSALTFVTSTLFGSANTRTKVPKGRSMR